MGCLCFDVVESIRASTFPDASAQSTLFACHRRYNRPAIYLEAAPNLKAKHDRAIQQGVQWLFDDLRPIAELRAVTLVPNEAADLAGFFIAPNMRIPECSLIHQMYSDESILRKNGTENLRDWEHSGGKRLADCDVRIEARRAKDRVIALVQPVS
jgi:hypothetical protein